jgi:hypothetical protein
MQQRTMPGKKQFLPRIEKRRPSGSGKQKGAHNEGGDSFDYAAARGALISLGVHSSKVSPASKFGKYFGSILVMPGTYEGTPSLSPAVLCLLGIDNRRSKHFLFSARSDKMLSA